MKYYYKIFLWENGAKSTEYTQYMTAPFFYEGHLDETLNTAEVILDSMPIETKALFPPKTKLRVERYETENCEDTPKTYDLVVNDDRVEEYPSCPEICCHRIDCISPSVVAQGMHTDNIALTYELQDCTIAYDTTLEVDTKVSLNVTNGGYNDPYRQSDTWTSIYTTFEPTF